MASLVAFVVSLNLARRHLTSSQKAMLALEIEKVLGEAAKQRQVAAGIAFGRGQEKVTQKIEQPITPRNNNSAAAQAAAAIPGTNRQYVSDAKKITTEAPDLVVQIRAGTISIPEAKQLAQVPQQARETIINKVQRGESKSVNQAVATFKHDKARLRMRVGIATV